MMNYKKHYDLLITRGKNRMLEGYVERHHIVPRCLGGTDDVENLVQLTPEEHYLAHQLLVKMYPNHFGLLSASMFMTSGNEHRKSNKVYGWLKRRYSEYMRGPNNPQKLNPMRGKDHPLYGVPFDPSCFTPEGLESIAAAKRGDKNPNYGIKPWNHGRATEYTKGVWAKADEIRKVWENNNKPSYGKLYSLVNGKTYGRDWEAIGPYMNLVKYFRNGWNPVEDEQWKEFVKNMSALTVTPLAKEV